ncbi:MAG: hypothetical protein H7175_10120, partial [Burkholderiales bacterium]|nr:hypothetical protein [Anaerolineae bacterium]
MSQQFVKAPIREQVAKIPIWLPMVGVCLLAWLMFLHHLGARSMWYDEWITWSFAKQPDIWGFVSRYPEGSGHPPLLYAYVWAWVRYTGTQDLFVMRLATL